MSSRNSITLSNDLEVIRALFIALRTSIPEDVRLQLMRESSMEVKFLIAVQPRVCGFSHRKRHSLRHPALSLSTKRYYYLLRAYHAMQRRQQGNLLQEIAQTDAAYGGDASEAVSYRTSHISSSHSIANSMASESSDLRPSSWMNASGGVLGNTISTIMRNSFGRAMEGDNNSLHSSTFTSGFFSSRSRYTETEDETDSELRLRRIQVGDRMVLNSQPHLVAFAGGIFLSDTPVSNGQIIEDPEEEMQVLAFVESEEDRWDKMGYCYDQLLCAARTACRVAAHTLALDPLVNDVIRRFWNRVTVSPADKQAYRQGLMDMAVAAEEINHSQQNHEMESVSGSSVEATTDDEAQQSNTNSSDSDDVGRLWREKSLTTFARSSSDREVSVSDDVEGGQSIRSSSSGGRADTPETSDPAPSPRVAVEKKKKRQKTAPAKPADGSVATTHQGKSKQPQPPPRLKAVAHGKQKKGAVRLLNATVVPSNNTVHSPSVRSGKSSKGPSGDGAAAAVPNSKIPLNGRRKLRRANTALYMTGMQYIYLNTRIAGVLLPPGNPNIDLEMLDSVRGDLLIDATYSEDGRHELYFGKAPSFVAPHGVTLAPQLMPTVKGGPATYDGRMTLQGGTSRSLFSSGDPDWGYLNESISHNSLSVDPSQISEHRAAQIWDPARLPSLTYGQFWASMLELVDNWTCTAGHPVEAAIFLLELYGEVFGNDWAHEDEVLLTALREKHLTQNSSTVIPDTEEVESILDSFNDMVQELDEWSSSISDYFLRSDDNSGSDSHTSSSILGPDGVRRKRRRRRFGTHGNGRSSAARRKRTYAEVDWSGRTKRDGWRYYRITDADGKEVLLRRKTVREPSKRRTNKEGRGGNADLDSMSHMSDSLYVIEETLDADGNRIRRRKLHRRGRRKDKVDRPGGDSPDTFMYQPCEKGIGSVRRYFDAPAKHLRRLEAYRRVDPDSGRQNSGLSTSTSWSSFSNPSDSSSPRTHHSRPLTEEDRKKLRRQRVRRHGPRAQRRRYPRDPAYYYGRISTNEGHDSDADSIAFSAYSYSVLEDAVADTEGNLVLQRGDADAAAASSTTALTAREREELLLKKEWLQRLLKARGLHIADAAFTDPNEEVLLFQLLKMTERIAAQKRAEHPDMTDEEMMEDIGVADFDTALLAKVFAKPKTYSLDDLQRSELMQLLLAMGDGEGGSTLTASQLGDILSALIRPPRSPPETTSMRRRRQKMIEQAMRLLNELKAAESERRRLAREEARRNSKKQSFNLAKSVVKPLTPPPSPPSLKRPIISLKHQHDGGDDAGLLLNTAFLPKPPASKPASYQRRLTPLEGLDELTRAQRRELDRLFCKLEEYTMAQASQQGRYKLSAITEYTLEQLEAFFNHLHLGPQQKALLLGRAPLAAPTSLVGGTLHQQLDGHSGPRVAFRFGGGSVGLTGVVDPGVTPMFRANPVKLFTLTTAESLEGAMLESYWNYMDDRRFHQVGGGGDDGGSVRLPTVQYGKAQHHYSSPWRQHGLSQLPPSTTLLHSTGSSSTAAHSRTWSTGRHAPNAPRMAKAAARAGKAMTSVSQSLPHGGGSSATDSWRKNGGTTSRLSKPDLPGLGSLPVFLRGPVSPNRRPSVGVPLSANSSTRGLEGDTFEETTAVSDSNVSWD